MNNREEPVCLKCSEGLVVVDNKSSFACVEGRARQCEIIGARPPVEGRARQCEIIRARPPVEERACQGEQRGSLE